MKLEYRMTTCVSLKNLSLTTLKHEDLGRTQEIDYSTKLRVCSNTFAAVEVLKQLAV